MVSAVEGMTCPRRVITAKYEFDANAVYMDPQVQAWATYYAQGGDDAAGLVFFTSVPSLGEKMNDESRPCRPPLPFDTNTPHATSDFCVKDSTMQDEDLGHLETVYGVKEARGGGSEFRLKCDFEPSRPDELSVGGGEVVLVIHNFIDLWSLVKNKEGKLGVVPFPLLLPEATLSSSGGSIEYTVHGQPADEFSSLDHPNTSYTDSSQQVARSCISRDPTLSQKSLRVIRVVPKLLKRAVVSFRPKGRNWRHGIYYSEQFSRTDSTLFNYRKAGFRTTGTGVRIEETDEIEVVELVEQQVEMGELREVMGEQREVVEQDELAVEQQELVVETQEQQEPAIEQQETEGQENNGESMLHPDTHAEHSLSQLVDLLDLPTPVPTPPPTFVENLRVLPTPPSPGHTSTTTTSSHAEQSLLQLIALLDLPDPSTTPTENRRVLPLPPLPEHHSPGSSAPTTTVSRPLPLSPTNFTSSPSSTHEVDNYRAYRQSTESMLELSIPQISSPPYCASPLPLEVLLDRSGSPPPPISPDALSPGGVTLVVKHDFSPSYPEEIGVRFGQAVHLIQTYDDQWSLIQDETGARGMVPSSCLKNWDEPTLRDATSIPSEEDRIDISQEVEPPTSSSTRVKRGSKRRDWSLGKEKAVWTLVAFIRGMKWKQRENRRTTATSFTRKKVDTSSANKSLPPLPFRLLPRLPLRPSRPLPRTNLEANSGSEEISVALPINPSATPGLPTSETSTSLESQSSPQNTPQESSSISMGNTSQLGGDSNLTLVMDPKEEARSSFLHKTRSQKLIYRNLFCLLIGEVSSNDTLRTTLYDYVASLRPLDLVSMLVNSCDYRTKLLQIVSSLNMSEDAKVREALRKDEPEIAQMFAEVLRGISRSETLKATVFALEGDDAQKFSDVVQDILEKGYLCHEESIRARRLLVRFFETCDKLPSSLFIKGVERPDDHATFGGGFGDVFKAYLADGRCVALKRMRTFQQHSDLLNIRRRFGKEALLWRHLNNKFIVPFLGIDAETFPLSLCLVSPWMRHGTVLKHIADHGKSGIDKRLHEVAQGLAYLHSQKIVHGDLRGANILINDEWQACLTDFGLTVFNDATASSSTSRRGGSVRWMAPELHIPESFGMSSSRLTPETDVYAFGCVCLELYTSRPPFADLLHDPAVILKVIQGGRPERPTDENEMSDQVWKVVEQCWDHQPTQRLKTDRVVEWMRVLSDLANLQTLPGTSMPMLPFTNENWNNLDTINKSTETTLFPQPLRMYWQHDYPDLPPVSPTSPTTPLPTPSRSESWIADDTLLDVENSGGSFENPIENVNGRMVIPVSRLTSSSYGIHQSDQILTALGSEAHNTGLLKNTKFACSSNCTLELEQALDKRLSFKPDNLLQNSQPVVPQSYAPILALLFMCFLFRSFALLYLILSCLLAWHLV